MKRIWKHLLTGVISTLVLCGLLWFAQRLLMPKYQSKSIEGSLTEEYYRETLPHDVLFIGDCEVFSNISPITLYRDFGIASYIRGSAQQLAWHSYYLLEDALQTEKPSVVVFNVLALKYGEPQSEAYNRMTIDGMRWSAAKIGVIRDSMTEGEDPVSYVFPLLRFHDRWSDLKAEDVRCLFRKAPVAHAGYLLRTDVRPVTQTPAVAPLTDPHLPDTSMEWLGKMADLCERNGIELVLIKSPSIVPHWYDEWDADIHAFAESRGIWYVNTLQENDAIGIDYTTDTCDMGQHLNVYGAEKLSYWFGTELKKRFEIADRRNDPAYQAVWSEKIERYETEKTASAAEEIK